MEQWIAVSYVFDSVSNGSTVRRYRCTYTYRGSGRGAPAGQRYPPVMLMAPLDDQCECTSVCFSGNKYFLEKSSKNAKRSSKARAAGTAQPRHETGRRIRESET